MTGIDLPIRFKRKSILLYGEAGKQSPNTLFVTMSCVRFPVSSFPMPSTARKLARMVNPETILLLRIKYSELPHLPFLLSKHFPT